MKNYLYLFFCFIFVQSLNAQDTIKSSNLLQLNVESNILLIDDSFDLIKGNSKSLPTFGVGISAGNSEKAFFNVGFRFSRFELDSANVFSHIGIADSSITDFRRRQLVLGGHIPIELTQKLGLVLKFNIAHNIIRQNITRNLISNSFGQIYALGIQTSPFDGIFFNMDFGYDYSGRAEKPLHTNLSGLFLSFGFSLGLPTN
jgi:hypothetical protein